MAAKVMKKIWDYKVYELPKPIKTTHTTVGAMTSWTLLDDAVDQDWGSPFMPLAVHEKRMRWAPKEGTPTWAKAAENFDRALELLTPERWCKGLLAQDAGGEPVGVFSSEAVRWCAVG